MRVVFDKKNHLKFTDITHLALSQKHKVNQSTGYNIGLGWNPIGEF